MTLEVRAVEPGDQPEWRRLWAGYLDFYGARVEPDVTTHTWRRMLDRANPMFGRIAVRGTRAAGFALCVSHEASWSLKPTCYLEDLFVDPEARGRGVARALVEDVIADSRSKQFASLYWHTRMGNRSARRLYDQYASADDFVRYRLTIDRAPAVGPPDDAGHG